jgi:hypothetical protein
MRTSSTAAAAASLVGFLAAFLATPAQVTAQVHESVAPPLSSFMEQRKPAPAGASSPRAYVRDPGNLQKLKLREHAELHV